MSQVYLILHCSKCDDEFAVTRENIKQTDREHSFGHPVIDIKCPYCVNVFTKGVLISFGRLQGGGVNVQGNAKISGDIVGGDQVNYR